ncbi:hypothetical protein [Paenibacillus montanisoli]|uniref:Uncharacterized protein n=1 Tax=Paenibacillus montanisoli TaxID=2081970 RepID=A0A328UCJ6_9BACL|nr:hypothetical protein [Paenibacillus montanisoli]RAP78034.1 hypothetical protein DL346_06195 [Paenibacillus montanisoli]
MAPNRLIAPSAYTPFESEEEHIQQLKDWGLLSEKASKTKSFQYKGSGMQASCSVTGYVDKLTAVLELEGGQLHCIHPSYLKEMQAASFGQRQSAQTVEAAEAAAEEAVVSGEPAAAEAAAAVEAVLEEVVEAPAAPKAKEQEKPAKKAKKEKAPKIELPEEKVKMIATVTEFTTVPNNFSDTDDEVVIYENVSVEEPLLELGTAWSSHSATLKKLELAIGDTISFECKVVAKKLTKHPVPYKINNPSKIVKQEA